MISRWILASNNPGKVKEFNRFFRNYLEFETIESKGIQSPQEPHKTFVENAIEKARYTARISGSPTIADDSGLIVDFLSGLPGVRSARFATSSNAIKVDQDKQNMDLLLELMTAVREESQRTCRFVCVIVALRCVDDPDPIISHGVWEGRINFEPKGTEGFGYDPIFYDPKIKKTAAQISLEEKSKWSHRAKALRKIKKVLIR